MDRKLISAESGSGAAMDEVGVQARRRSGFAAVGWWKVCLASLLLWAASAASSPAAAQSLQP